MTDRSGFVDYVVERLHELEDVDARRMFGGHGLYLDGIFFGLIFDDRLYLKTNDETRGWYEARGMSSFRPNERQHLKTYFEVPTDALENADQLLELVEGALEAQTPPGESG